MSPSENERPRDLPADPDDVKARAKAAATFAARELSDAELDGVSAAGSDSDPDAPQKGGSPSKNPG